LLFAFLMFKLLFTQTGGTKYKFGIKKKRFIAIRENIIKKGFTCSKIERNLFKI